MIQSCNCGKCRKESEHNLGFVWERKGDRWFKSYSIKETSTRRIVYPYGKNWPVYR